MTAYLLRLGVTLVISVGVWLGVRPLLDGLVAGGAEVLLRAFEVPRVTRLVPVDHRAEVRRSDFRSDSALPTVPLTEIHFNTVVLLIGSFILGLSMESITAWLIFALWLQAAGIWVPSILQVVWWRFNSWGYLAS